MTAEGLVKGRTYWNISQQEPNTVIANEPDVDGDVAVKEHYSSDGRFGYNYCPPSNLVEITPEQLRTYSLTQEGEG